MLQMLPLMLAAVLLLDDRMGAAAFSVSGPILASPRNPEHASI
jgi:hypothetical protein